MDARLAKNQDNAGILTDMNTVLIAEKISQETS
jgi:hypothetical protein